MSIHLNQSCLYITMKIIPKTETTVKIMAFFSDIQGSIMMNNNFLLVTTLFTINQRFQCKSKNQ